MKRPQGAGCGCHPSPDPASRLGLTIVELLVVIAVIGLLVAILLPAIQAARESSRLMTCKSHLRQIALSAANYSGTHRHLPPLWSGHGNHPWEHFSWRMSLLPFLEESVVFDRLNRRQPPLHTSNRGGATQQIAIYQCPSTPGAYRVADVLGTGESQLRDLGVAAHDYSAVYDVSVEGREFPLRGIWNGGPELEFTESLVDVPVDRFSAELRRKIPKLKRVQDGLSHTILLAEQAGKPKGFGRKFRRVAAAPTEGAWATGDYSSFFGEGVNLSNYTDPYGFHGKANAALGDGAVVSLHKDISPCVLVALLSRDGNEIVSRADWE